MTKYRIKRVDYKDGHTVFELQKFKTIRIVLWVLFFWYPLVYFIFPLWDTINQTDSIMKATMLMDDCINEDQKNNDYTTIIEQQIVKKS